MLSPKSLHEYFSLKLVDANQCGDPEGIATFKSWCNLAFRTQGNGWKIVAEGLCRVQDAGCRNAPRMTKQLRVVLEQSAIYQGPPRLKARPRQIFNMKWYRRSTKEEEG